MQFRLFQALLMSLCLLLFAISPLQAQGGIASVNLALIFNFHPLVQFFSPEEGFFLKTEDGMDFAKRAEKNSATIREAEQKIGELYRKLENVTTKRQEADYNAWRDKRRIETDIQSTRDNPANAGKTLDFSAEEKKMLAIDEEAKKSQSALAEEEKQIIREAIDWNNKLKAINYYTGNDHLAMVKKISDEVRGIIRDIAKEKNCPIVLNSSQFQADRRHRTASGFPSPYRPAEGVAPGSIYAAENQENVNAILTSHQGAEAQEFARAAMDQHVQGFQQMMEAADQYLVPFGDSGVHDLMAAGGLDITAEVMNRLLLKYKIEPALVQLITVGIRSRKLF